MSREAVDATRSNHQGGGKKKRKKKFIGWTLFYPQQTPLCHRPHISLIVGMASKRLPQLQQKTVKAFRCTL